MRQRGAAFVRTARGLCVPVKCLLVSALHLFCLSLVGGGGAFGGVGLKKKKMEALKSEFLMGLHSLPAWLWEFSHAPQWECVKWKDHMYS